MIVFAGYAKSTNNHDSISSVDNDNFPIGRCSIWSFEGGCNQSNSISTWDMLFARFELSNHPTLSIGYGGYWGQIYLNGGYGMVGGLIGDGLWGGSISLGGRMSFVDDDNYFNSASMGLRYGHYFVNGYEGGGIYFDAVYSHKNWDYILGFSFGDFGENTYVFGEDDGTFMTIIFGIGYNIRSRKYWDYIKRKNGASSSITPTITPQYSTPTYTTPTKPQYSPCPEHTRSVIHSEFSLKEQINKEIDGIVGIYEDYYGLRVGVVKQGSGYRIIYMEGSSNDCWEFGHVKADLRSSAANGIFKGTWFMRDFSGKDNCLFSFDEISMSIFISGEEYTFLKMFPSQGGISGKSNEPERWSGTCWAIGNGYLVTNYHVVDGAKRITISGIKGDFNNKCSAEIIAIDNVNDIAILHINDEKFSSLGIIPYSVTSRMADVGEDVFVLGYPLTQTMGDEIKLTNGIISSRTGFQGDVSLYQMSAPIQPGNSGGPMFDSKGNVIGIVVAHHKGAENVGYAIKTSYLRMLIETSGIDIPFPKNNTISSLSLAEKVKRVKNFIFYVECSK